MATGPNTDVSTVDAELKRKIKELEDQYGWTNARIRLAGEKIEARKLALERKRQELRRAEATIVHYKAAIDDAGGFAETTKNITTAESKLAKNEAEIKKLENDNATTDLMLETFSKGISCITADLKTELINKLREIDMKNLTIQDLQRKKSKAEALEGRTSRRYRRVVEALEGYEDSSKIPNPVNTSEEVEDAVRIATSHLTEQLDEITKSTNETEENIREIRIRKSANESKIAELKKELIDRRERVRSLEEELTSNPTKLQEVNSLWLDAMTSKISLDAALKAKLEICVSKRQQSNVGPTVNSGTPSLLESLFKNRDGVANGSDLEKYPEVHQLLMYIFEYGIDIGQGSK